MTRRRKSLGDVGEHAWLRALLPTLEGPSPQGRVRVGPGDDAAVLESGGRPVVITTDALVEGVHFDRAWFTPRALGRRAYRVAASDVAAMGARPTAAVVAVAAPPTTPSAALSAITRGLAHEAAADGASLVGGNLTKARDLSITVTVLGDATRKIVERSGARVGDRVAVTGPLGAAAAALAAARAGERRRWPAVPNRIDTGQALALHVRAMIDVSDGCAQDLGHLGRASGVGAEVDLDRLPVARACRRRAGNRAAELAFVGGDDYELLVTVAPRRLAAARRAAERTGATLVDIGTVVAGPPRVAAHRSGRAVSVRAAEGFDHFR